MQEASVVDAGRSVDVARTRTRVRAISHGHDLLGHGRVARRPERHSRRDVQRDRVMIRRQTTIAAPRE